MKTFLFTLLFPILALGASAGNFRTLNADYIKGVAVSDRNYAKQVYFEENLSFISCANFSTCSIASTDVIQGVNSLSLLSTSLSGLVKIDVATLEKGLYGKICEGSIDVYTTAAGAPAYDIYIENNGSEVTGTRRGMVSQQNITFNYKTTFACGSSSDGPYKFVIDSTNTTNATIRVDNLYVGLIRSQTIPVTVQVLTSGTTYTKSPGAVRIEVLAVGPGGGSGGVTTAAAASAAAAGGGGGGCAWKVYNNPSATYTYAIGTVGAQGNSGGTAGTAGTATTFDTLTANGGGGGGGSGAAATPAFKQGGIGGTASGGDYNISGTPGGHGIIGSSTEAAAGHGGSSCFGGGAQGLANSNSVGSTTGTAYGGGASGAININNGGAAAGADGGPGAVFVKEFYN